MALPISSEKELQKFLTKLGFIAQSRVIIRINTQEDGVLISDRYDNMFFIQKVGFEEYLIYRRGKVK